MIAVCYLRLEFGDRVSVFEDWLVLQDWLLLCLLFLQFLFVGCLKILLGVRSVALDLLHFILLVIVFLVDLVTQIIGLPRLAIQVRRIAIIMDGLSLFVIVGSRVREIVVIHLIGGLVIIFRLIVVVELVGEQERLICLGRVDVVTIVRVAIVYDHFLVHMITGFAMRRNNRPYRVMKFWILELLVWVTVRSLLHHGIDCVDLQVLVHLLRILQFKHIVVFNRLSLVLDHDTVGGVADVSVGFLVYAHMGWLAKWLLLGRLIAETLVICTL